MFRGCMWGLNIAKQGAEFWDLFKAWTLKTKLLKKKTGIQVRFCIIFCYFRLEVINFSIVNLFKKNHTSLLGLKPRFFLFLLIDVCKPKSIFWSIKSQQLKLCQNKMFKLLVRLLIEHRTRKFSCNLLKVIYYSKLAN